MKVYILFVVLCMFTFGCNNADVEVYNQGLFDGASIGSECTLQAASSILQGVTDKEYTKQLEQCYTSKILSKSLDYVAKNK